MKPYAIVLAAVMALTACGGGSSPQTPIQSAPEASYLDEGIEYGSASSEPVAARKKPRRPPAPTPEPTPTPDPTPDPIPLPPPAPSNIVLGDWPNTLLQTGWDHAAYWLEDGVWGAGSLTRGTYTGINGSQYEQKTGVSPTMGPNGEVTGRMTWKWPTGTTEVKSYPSFVVGNKPGWKNSWTVPGGHEIRLLDGSISQVYPSGKTPGSFFPLQLPIQSLKSTFAYTHNEAPTGRGHLAYDIWLQNTPEQCHGFNNCKELTHEIMIPLNSWGNYGVHGVGRNPAWYDHDVVIDGRLFHVYVAKGADGQLRPDFFGGWKFIVFQPAQSIQPGEIDLAKFINYLTTRRDSAGTPWAAGNEYLASVELGVEPVDGTGDLTISNFRVWK